jgi:hypothetical protein
VLNIVQIIIERTADIASLMVGRILTYKIKYEEGRFVSWRRPKIQLPNFLKSNFK